MGWGHRTGKSNEEVEVASGRGGTPETHPWSVQTTCPRTGVSEAAATGAGEAL